jgi:hypothetical protein
MKAGIGAARRTIVACAVLLVALAAQAQDPRAVAAQTAAREWLRHADALDAATTWNSAGVRFQQALPLARWSEGLKREREARGPLVQRAVAATTFGSSFRGLPPGGSYALVRFRSVFAKRPASAEDVTLEQGADGAWRVIGYVIR